MIIVIPQSRAQAVNQEIDDAGYGPGSFSISLFDESGREYLACGVVGNPPVLNTARAAAHKGEYLESDLEFHSALALLGLKIIETE
jgi:hypothetical protein